MRKVIMLGLFLCLGLLSLPFFASANDDGEVCYWTKAEFLEVAAEYLFGDGTMTKEEFLRIAAAYLFGEPKPCEDDTDYLQGLTIAPEDRCSEYDRDDYRYPQSVEADIVAAMGGIIYGPYTGTHFESTTETDIEHIVAVSEAHDSGMCAATDDEKDAFARDLLNLTLASPSVNRHQKRAHDAAEWLPELNQCWYADRIVQVRVKYELTVDQSEADALIDVLEDCESTEMIITDAPGE